jgi:RHS repeat-associated protein
MNRLVETTENTDGTEIKTWNLYDNAGNRLAKKTVNMKTSKIDTDLYLRHGQIAVAMDIEIDESSTTERSKINRYVLSGDLLAGRVTTTIKLDGSKVVAKSWYHLDHLNSTKCVTDATGKLEVMYEYCAFGEQLKRMDANKADPGDKAKYSYGGKELDDETNLYYFNARFYDATTGRFINVDPVQDGTNWYIYCNDNPLNAKDPTGLEWKTDKLPSQEFHITNISFSQLVENANQLAEKVERKENTNSFIDKALIISTNIAEIALDESSKLLKIINVLDKANDAKAFFNDTQKESSANLDKFIRTMCKEYGKDAFDIKYNIQIRVDYEQTYFEGNLDGKKYLLQEPVIKNVTFYVADEKLENYTQISCKKFGQELAKEVKQDNNKNDKK